MYIIAPLILIVISLAGIALIIRRKLPYLRKLSPEAHAVNEHLFEDYFPELVEWFKEFKWHEYRQAALREIEKGLRRLRLAVMKIDHASDRLIKKIRKVHLATHLEQTLADADKATSEKSAESSVSAGPMQTAVDDLKIQEQKLIIEIAQDPKNAPLYEQLGDLYMKMGSTQDAREAYEAALGFNPDNLAVARKYSAILKKTETAN